MKTSMLLCFVWMLAIESVTGQIPAIDQIETEPVTENTGFSFKLHSVILNEDRTIFISLPVGYDNQTKKYPVLYMLDGQWNFSHTAQTMAWLSRCYAGKIPHTIVVGIHTGENRERDLSPTQNKESKSGGGADKFYKFLKEELIPFIDKNYSTYNYRILGGVSLGGLFVMHAFTVDPRFFQSYVALSPSMWWDNRVMLNKTEAFLSGNPRLHNRLYLALANEGQQMGVDSLVQIIKKYSPKELSWKFDPYPEEVHETVNYKGIYDGMKFIFADWYYPFVNFGMKEDLFFEKDPVKSTSVQNENNLSAGILNSLSELYQDSYGRILTITKTDTALLFSADKLPVIPLYSGADNKYFIKQTDVKNRLFLKNTDIKFEFIKNDSLKVTADGKMECTAKKIKHPPLVKLSDDLLERYVGTYLPSDQSKDLIVTKDGNLLKLSSQSFITSIYPIGDHKFFSFVDGSGFELEFSKDESNNEMKMSISGGGKVLLEAKKVK
jgi:predicted alpha/beta superfamily hydrolase